MMDKRLLGLANHLTRRVRARRGDQGVTLVEILIVLAIVGLIAGGIAVYAIPKFQQAQKETTKQSAMALYGVAALVGVTLGGRGNDRFGARLVQAVALPLRCRRIVP